MRIILRKQLTVEEWAKAIASGIREASKEAGEIRRQRRIQDFKEADEVLGGLICKNIDELIKNETALITQLFTSPTPANVKAIRTEIERLITYLAYRRLCKG